jgi:hypothetical protein
MTTKAQQREQAEAVERLREMIHPGDTVRTILRHVSASGMSRSISLIIIDEDGDTFDVSWIAARALGDRIDQKNDGIKVSGCGMDMGFHLVYGLSATLFPDGFECIGDGDGYPTRCPSNDHSNGDIDYSPHHHSRGGYALKHRWL